MYYGFIGHSTHGPVDIIVKADSLVEAGRIATKGTIFKRSDLMLNFVRDIPDSGIIFCSEEKTTIQSVSERRQMVPSVVHLTEL